MIHVKPGVFFHPETFNHYQMMRVFRVPELLVPKGYEPTITSGADGHHAATSKHNTGCAIDYRIYDFPGGGAAVNTWCRRLQARLGDEYFVLVEPDHLHVQWNGLEVVK